MIGAAPGGNTTLKGLRLKRPCLDVDVRPLDVRPFDEPLVDEPLDTRLPADTPPVPLFVDASAGMAGTATAVMQISVVPSARNRTATSFVGLRG